MQQKTRQTGRTYNNKRAQTLCAPYVYILQQHHAEDTCLVPMLLVPSNDRRGLGGGKNTNKRFQNVVDGNDAEAPIVKTCKSVVFGKDAVFVASAISVQTKGIPCSGSCSENGLVVFAHACSSSPRPAIRMWRWSRTFRSILLSYTNSHAIIHAHTIIRAH